MNELDTSEKRNQFLEDIYDVDQNIRKNRIQQENAHGYLSPEVRESYKIMMEEDLKNIQLISAYLDRFGYPRQPAFTNKAIHAPYIVIHHTSGNEYRKKYFPMLYESHRRGDFKSLAFFLGRMHDVEFGHFMSFENPYTETFEIEELTRALGLQAVMRDIDQQIEKEKD